MGAETDLFVVYWCVICNWSLIYRSPARPAVPRRSANLGPRAILPLHFIFYAQNSAFENVHTMCLYLLCSIVPQGKLDIDLKSDRMWQSWHIFLRITSIAGDLEPGAGGHPEPENCARQRGQIWFVIRGQAPGRLNKTKKHNLTFPWHRDVLPLLLWGLPADGEGGNRYTPKIIFLMNIYLSFRLILSYFQNFSLVCSLLFLILHVANVHHYEQ